MAKKKVKILSIFGTRKELIKLYPVLEKLASDDDIDSIVVTTSQHQEDFDDLYALFRNLYPKLKETFQGLACAHTTPG